MSDDQLDFALARFISEVRREDREEFPGTTLYEIYPITLWTSVIIY